MKMYISRFWKSNHKSNR